MRKFLLSRADAARSLGRLPSGQGQQQSAQPCLIHPSHLLTTPTETWMDGTNIQPHFRGETVHSPDSTPIAIRDSHESLSVSGIQCREVAPPLPPITDIQDGSETPRAKALAAVVSPHNIDPQDNPLATIGIQRADTVALSVKESASPMPDSSPYPQDCPSMFQSLSHPRTSASVLGGV